MQHATGATEKERMALEADFSSRQAWALCPGSTEAVFRYVALLMQQERVADALLVAETAAQMPPMQGQEGQPMRDLIVSLKEILKAKQAASGGK